MLFHEIYGCYYRAVVQMLNLAIAGGLTEKKMYEIVAETAFEESSLIMIPALKKQEWQLLDENLHTPLKHTPDMPLTILEKRWLKTILLDKRVKLFFTPMSENTEQTDFVGGNAEQAVFVVANAKQTDFAGVNADFAAACPPDVVADAVQVKAKKIEMISVASIVFFMLENLLFFTNRHIKGGCVRCFSERKNTSFVEKERTLW